AWGSFADDRDNRWNTDVDISGLLEYPMAAFARRVAANPTAFSPQYQQDAIRFTSAVMETYNSFRDEMYLSDTPWAYYKFPTTYSTLVCNVSDGTLKHCEDYRYGAGRAIPWNQNLSFMKVLGEVASAADSSLYRSSSDDFVRQLNVYYA